MMLKKKVNSFKTNKLLSLQENCYYTKRAQFFYGTSYFFNLVLIKEKLTFKAIFFWHFKVYRTFNYSS